MIVVRILRDRRVVREAVLQALPATLGRGADSDVVLPDPSVSRAHARIERTESGDLRLLDLGSRNGVRLAGRPVGEIRLDRRLTCRVGGVEIEIEPVSDAPTIEVDAREWQRFERTRSAPRTLLSLAAAVAGVATARVVQPDFWSPWNHGRWVDLLGTSLGAVVGMPLVAGVMLVGLRAVGRSIRFGDTMRVVAAVVWIAPVVSLLLQAAYYPLSPPAYAWFRAALGAAVGIAVVVTVATVRRRPPSRRFALAWAAFTLLLGAAAAWTTALTERQSGAPSVDLLVQPPIAGYAGTAGSLDDYLAAVREAAGEGEGAAGELNRPTASLATGVTGR